VDGVKTALQNIAAYMNPVSSATSPDVRLVVIDEVHIQIPVRIATTMEIQEILNPRSGWRWG